MKLRMVVLTVAVALLGVSAAFATPPTGKGKPASTPASTNAAKPTVMWVLHGTITAYTAVNGATNGSVSLTVNSSNHVAKGLKGQTIAFTISASSNVVGTPTVGHKATVKVRAAKATVSSLLAATGAIRQLIDQGTTA